jgi:DNA-binding MarR family transcriptional regulator
LRPRQAIGHLESPNNAAGAAFLFRWRFVDRMGQMPFEPAQEAIYPPMSKPKARSTLYRLIEAGQLARRALLVPLLDRNLEPGDDAIIFALRSRLGATEAALAEELQLDAAALDPRLARLAERDLITRQAIGPDLVPGLALTERGERICEVLSANWDQLEGALFGELDDKQRKKLDKTLKRFVDLLRL